MQTLKLDKDDIKEIFVNGRFSDIDKKEIADFIRQNQADFLSI
jgi:hypothetical protein